MTSASKPSQWCCILDLSEACSRLFATTRSLCTMFQAPQNYRSIISDVCEFQRLVHPFFSNVQRNFVKLPKRTQMLAKFRQMLNFSSSKITLFIESCWSEDPIRWIGIWFLTESSSQNSDGPGDVISDNERCSSISEVGIGSRWPDSTLENVAMTWKCRPISEQV